MWRGPLHNPITTCALLAVALYAVTLGGTFVYDDVPIILLDKRLADPSLWGQFWTGSYNDGVDNLYRPLVSMTYAIQHWLHGTTAWPYHLVNVLLHALASGMVAWFATKLARRCRLARFDAIGWIAGLLFAAHPVHVEAVANVVGRAELMCTIGAVGALGLSLDPLTPRRVVAIGALFVLALLSKEQGMLVPAMVGVVLLAPNASAHSAFGIRHSALFLILTIPLATYVVLKESVLHLKFWWERNFLDAWIQPLATSAGTDRLLAPITIVGRYFELLVVPHTLRIDYGGVIVPGVFRADDPHFWLGVAGVVSWLTLLIVGILRKDRVTLVATLLFGIAYAVIGNLLTIIGVNMAERLMYLPSAFFVILVARGLSALPARVAVVAVAGIVSLMSIRTATYAYRWNDRLAFYEYQVRVEPRSMKSLLLALDEHQDRGDLDAAARLGRQAIELAPTYDEAYLRFAGVLIDRGEFTEAQRMIETAATLKPQGKAPAYFGRLEEGRATTRAAGH